MFYIDSHCHIDFECYDKDRDEIIQNAKNENVQYLINIGCEKKSNEKARKNSKNYKNVFFTAGIHPSDVETEDDSVFDQIRAYSEDEKMCAVGEIGLDYYKYDNDRKLQKSFFQKAIHLAHDIQKPLVIHNRDAHDDMYEILKSNQIEKIGAVMHCFSGTADYASRILDLSLYISLTGVITFKNADYDEVIQRVPMDRLLLETDSPFLTPHPFRGKRNEPSRLKLIAQKIANVKKMDISEVMSQTTQNTIRLFNLEKMITANINGL